jgi:hypothetical protein
MKCRVRVKHDKWWPPARRKAKLLTAIVNHIITPEIEAKVNRQVMDDFIYDRSPCAPPNNVLHSNNKRKFKE